MEGRKLKAAALLLAVYLCGHTPLTLINLIKLRDVYSKLIFLNVKKEWNEIKKD